MPRIDVSKRNNRSEVRLVVGSNDAFLGDKTGDELVWRYIKGGIAYLYTLGGSSACAKGGDLPGFTFLYGDAIAGWRIQIDCGRGACHIKGDREVSGEDRNTECAYFVGKIAVGCDAITTYDTQINKALRHHEGSHVVTDERDIQASALEFP